MPTTDDGQHLCEGDLPTEGPEGHAVDLCESYEDGTLWVYGKGAVSSQVGFCPYCGYRAQVLPDAVFAAMMGIRRPS